MELEVKAWLFDVLQAIQDIDTCIAPGTTYSSFERDRRTQLAVERSIEKIGEAMRRILDRDHAIAITNAWRIVQARNKIIHQYDAVNITIIWLICERDIPVLRTEVEALLNDHG